MKKKLHKNEYMEKAIEANEFALAVVKTIAGATFVVMLFYVL